MAKKIKKEICNDPKETFFQKWGVVFVLSLALAIILIDATLLNVSLSVIIKDFNTDIQSIQWVITAYSLTIAALTITGGRLGDLFGRKRMFVWGAIIFAIGSFIASESHNVPTMIIGESIIEGIGAAMMMPATASLLVSKYHGRDRGIAFGIWGGVAAASTAIGPLLGGWLTSNYSWRWGFRINVFVAALLIFGSVLIKECRDTEEKPNLDWTGVFLSSFGLLALVFGIIESSTYGWWKAKEVFAAFGQNWNFGGYSITPISIGVGLLVLLLFMIWERGLEKKGQTPLVSLHLFQNRQFVSGMVTTGILSLGQAGLIFSIPVFMQAVRGEDAFHTGLTLLPMSLAALFVAPMAGFLSHKYFSPKRLVQAGLLANLIGYLIIRGTLNINTTPNELIFGLLVMGAGMGLVMAQINNVTLSAVSVQQAGEASGVNNTFRQIGSTLGTAIIGAVLITNISNNLASGIKSSNVIPAQYKSLISEQVKSQTSNVEFGGGAKIPGNLPKKLTDEITKISHQSVTDANKVSLYYAALIALAGFVTAFWLPGQKQIETEKSVAPKLKKKIDMITRT